MKREFRHNGFSLTEVLMAVGILTVGLLLVATMFPLGIQFTTVSVERTMAAIVADEAFAKIQLYGLETDDLYDDIITLGMICLPVTNYLPSTFNTDELAYPSVNLSSPQYYWTARVRKLVNRKDETSVQVTVFVSRKRGVSNTYGLENYPVFLEAEVTPIADNKITIDTSNRKLFINPPTTIIERNTGNVYRVVKREDDVLTLDRDWETVSSPAIVFLRPPNGANASEAVGANPDIGVFQRVIKF